MGLSYNLIVVLNPYHQKDLKKDIEIFLSEYREFDDIGLKPTEHLSVFSFTPTLELKWFPVDNFLKMFFNHGDTDDFNSVYVNDEEGHAECFNLKNWKMRLREYN